jgi:hypothetical protein
LTVYGFADRTTAEKLRQMAGLPAIRDTRTTPEEGANWEVRTPSAGIAAKTAAAETYPSAECDLFYIVTDSAGVIRRVQALDGSTPVKLRVGNRSTTAIPGNRFVSATRYIGGAYIVTVDDC